MRNLLVLTMLVLSGCNGGGGGASGGGGGGSSSSGPAFNCPQNHHTTPHVIIFGDSMAANYDTLPNYGWANRVALALNMPTQNFAIPGTAMDANNQFNTIMCVEINSDDIVLYQPGVNDEYQKKDIGRYRQMLEAILNRIHETHAVGLMGTTTRLEFETGNGFTNAGLDARAQVMRDLFNANNFDRMRLVDVNQLFDSTLPGNMNDQVHPSSIGYDFIANLYVTTYQAM